MLLERGPSTQNDPTTKSERPTKTIFSLECSQKLGMFAQATDSLKPDRSLMESNSNAALE
jgi:hypothetical protein